jgi:hypothetical protein
VRLLKLGIFIAISAIASLVAFLPSSAFAIDAPGLNITIPFQPDYIKFPDRYQQNVPAIYQAHLALLKYPAMLSQLRLEREAQEGAILADSSLNPVTKREKLDAMKAEMDAKVDLLNKEQAEMRKAYLLLSRDYLTSQVDPYILFFMAQAYYHIRGQAPEITKQELDEAAHVQTEEQQASESPASPEVKAPEVVKEGVAESTESAPKEEPAVQDTGKNPSMAVIQDYKTNYERIIAALGEIRQRYPEFEHMDQVVRYLAVLNSEMGKQDKEVGLIKLFLKKYPQSPYYGEMLFRLAEWQFATPFAFDHFSIAVETYDKALKHYDTPNRNRWRVIYKKAWAQYLSPDLSADAMDTFVKLYKEMSAQPQMTMEMLSIRAEIIEVIKQIRAVEHVGNTQQGESVFGR